jgi:hypothetical protein
MKTVLQTHSLSWAESVRLALLSQDIDAVVLDQYSMGTAGLAGGLRVAILDDSDLESATRVLAELQPPRSAPLPSWWWHKRALLAFAAGFVALFLKSALPDVSRWRSLHLPLSGASLLLFFGALGLYRRGNRADRPPTLAHRTPANPADDGPVNQNSP